MSAVNPSPSALSGRRSGRAARTAVNPRPVIRWLLVCAFLVLAMAVIGAITRLTESGLSMVEWKPLIGILPPLSAAEWERVFGLYRETPEFRHINSWMQLDDFKLIFWWEWFHRMWGQLIGFAFTIPLVWFALTRRIPRGLMPRLLALLALGGLQGLIGWYMVMSGLVERPSVSHYRLALHLTAALLIFALLLQTAWSLMEPDPLSGWHESAGSVRWLTGVALALATLTVIWGAFVAGTDAGLAYNTFPLMDGRLIPEEIDTLSPWWLNAFENTAAIQLIHRALAMTTLLVVLALAWQIWRIGLPGKAPGWAMLSAILVLVQVGLGIATLLTMVVIPLAAAHQAGAFLLVGALTILRYQLRAPS